MKSKSVLVSLNPLSLPRLEAILAYAREHAWAVILEDRLPEGGLGRIDGALVSLRGKKGQLDKIRILQRLGKPVVDLTIACPKIRLPRVISDHEALGELAARHFLERGFENFAWYASGSSHVHDLRRNGFAKTLRRAGFTLSNLSSPPNLSNLPLPLAILAYDEPDAARIIAICRAHGFSIPGQIAVLGIGNDPFLCENSDITISSVDQNLGRAAREACNLLDDLMSSAHKAPSTRHKAPSTVFIPPTGVIPRASTETLAHPNPVIRAALVFIHRNLHRPFGAAETAKAVGIPRSTLDHLFTIQLGHSIGAEILSQRLRRAQRLLKDRAVALKNIAAACGFCNASYFTNTFRRKTGLTPKAWRQTNVC